MRKQFYLLLLFTCFIFLCDYAQSNKSMPDSIKKQLTRVKLANKKKAASTQFQYFIIKAENNTYGYDIFANGSLYIHQVTIPAMNGNNGFADTLTAGKTARLAIKKIKQGISPPTITTDELKKLKIILP